MFAARVNRGVFIPKNAVVLARWRQALIREPVPAVVCATPSLCLLAGPTAQGSCHSCPGNSLVRVVPAELSSGDGGSCTGDPSSAFTHPELFPFLSLCRGHSGVPSCGTSPVRVGMALKRYSFSDLQTAAFVSIPDVQLLAYQLY